MLFLAEKGEADWCGLRVLLIELSLVPIEAPVTVSPPSETVFFVLSEHFCQVRTLAETVRLHQRDTRLVQVILCVAELPLEEIDCFFEAPVMIFYFFDLCCLCLHFFLQLGVVRFQSPFYFHLNYAVERGKLLFELESLGSEAVALLPDE